MMKIDKVLKGVLEKIKLDEKELGKMNSGIKEFVSELEKKIRKNRIKADVFVGGSSGKGTVVRRKTQDIDVFVRFKNEKEISKLEKIIPGKKKKIHGSRDYFKSSYKKLNFEVVPVLKIKKPQEARNVTDLSYFHVSYIKSKMNKTMSKEVLLAKAFCKAHGV